MCIMNRSKDLHKYFTFKSIQVVRESVFEVSDRVDTKPAVQSY